MAEPPIPSPAGPPPAVPPADPRADAPAVPWAVPDEPSGPAPGIDFAPHGGRFVAYVLDGIILSLVVLVLSLGFFALWLVARGPTGGDQTLGIVLAVAWFVVTIVVSVGYFPYFWQHSGQTPGMRPFRLWVVRDRDGGPIGWGTASLRVLGLYVGGSVFYLGYIWIFIDKRRRGWHDLIAGTVVIRRARDQTR